MSKNYNDLLVAFQLSVRKVIALAVSRERCVFHVDRMWTSTRGRGSGSCGRMWTGGGGVKNPIFCGRHKWMAPNCNRKFEISTAPTKAKSREPAYSQSLVQNEIDWQRVRARESGKQTVRH